MKILLTNDDGYNAVGIIETALALVKAGHGIMIAAPAQNMSCVSHGLTLRRPLHAEAKTLPELPGVRVYAVDGTPSDCVRLALGNLGFDPDLIVSGMNDEPNLGSDAVYSGTISAAIEGFMVDKPSIAAAKDGFDTAHMREASECFADMLPGLMRFFESGPGMLSVNFPACAREDYRGVRVCGLALQRYELRYDETKEPDGRTAYSARRGKKTICAEDDITDEKAVRDGYVVVTPLTYDVADRERFGHAKRLFEKEAPL